MPPAGCHSVPNIVLGFEPQGCPCPSPCCFEPRAPSPLVTSPKDTPHQFVLRVPCSSGSAVGGWEGRRRPVRSSPATPGLSAGPRGVPDRVCLRDLLTGGESGHSHSEQVAGGDGTEKAGAHPTGLEGLCLHPAIRGRGSLGVGSAGTPSHHGDTSALAPSAHLPAL